MQVSATVKNGKFVINSVRVVIQNEHLILFECDCRSKYPDVICTDGNEVTVVPNESAMYLDETSEDEHTIITLGLPEGWVVSLTDTGRYSILILAMDYNEYQRDPGEDWNYLWNRELIDKTPPEDAALIERS